MKVKCKLDFGYFVAGEIYSAQPLTGVLPLAKDAIWTLFFNDRDDGTGGSRKILGTDLRDFFEVVKNE